MNYTTKTQHHKVKCNSCTKMVKMIDTQCTYEAGYIFYDCGPCYENELVDLKIDSAKLKESIIL